MLSTENVPFEALLLTSFNNCSDSASNSVAGNYFTFDPLTYIDIISPSAYSLISALFYSLIILGAWLASQKRRDYKSLCIIDLVQQK